MMAPQIHACLPLSSFEISASLERNTPATIIMNTINAHIIKTIITSRPYGDTTDFMDARGQKKLPIISPLVSIRFVVSK